MKLKCIPDDFQVEELTEFQPDGGRFAYYRLTKRSLGTPEVLAALARRWNISRASIAAAGLKDRHALTTQYVTIERGPRRDLKQDNFSLEYVGQASRPFDAKDIAGNRFVVVLRNLTRARIEQATAVLEQVSHDGLPNYFDDQRFGSLGESGQFVAEPWCQGNYERALWLAIAEANAHDRSPLREEKACLRAHWGAWEQCRGELKQSSLHVYVNHLVQHPHDYRRALALVPQPQRALFLAAFQSSLWNELLAAYLVQECRPEQLQSVKFTERRLYFPLGLTATQRAAFQATVLPLPSARVHLPAGPLQQLLQSTLAARGLELRELRVKYPRDSFFSRVDRKALFWPRHLTSESAPDELYAARRKFVLRFDLPRGAYATVLVKRLALAHAETPDD